MDTNFPTVPGYDGTYLEYPHTCNDDSETVCPTNNTAEPLGQQQDLLSIGMDMDLATLSGYDQANLFPPGMLNYSGPICPTSTTAKPLRQQQGPGTGKQPQPSALDWFTQRPLIEKLYRSHGLEYVMKEMKQRQNFHASKKMYKDKFGKWDIINNVKKSEKPAILHRLDKRKADGKASILRVRGHKIPIHRVERYRKQVEEMDRSRRTRQISCTPSSIEIYTPPPSPVMAGPSYLESLDRILRARDAHFKGSLACGNWFVGESRIQVTSTTCHTEITQMHMSLKDAVINALGMLACGDSYLFGMLLNTAIQRLERVLNLDCGDTWNTLMYIIRKILRGGKVEVAQSLFRYSAQFLRARSRQRHPLYHFVQNVSMLLNETGTEQLWQAMKIVEQSYTDMLIRLAGSEHWLAIRAQADHIVQYGDVVSFDRDRAMSHKLISDRANQYGSDDWKTYWVRWTFAEYLHCNVGRSEEAIEILSYIINQGQYLSKDYASLLSSSYWGRSVCHVKCGNIAMAEMDLRCAIELEETAFGQNPENKLVAITSLEELHLRYRLEGAAAETREERLRLVEQMKKAAEDEDKARFGRKL